MRNPNSHKGTEMAKPHTTLSEAILALPLPTPTILDTAALTSWEAEVFARGALAMRNAAALVEAQETQEPAREGWTACGDRLPEVRDDSVLVLFDHGGIDMVHIQEYFGDITNGYSDDGEQLYTKYYKTAGVTHWMSLPVAPAQIVPEVCAIVPLECGACHGSGWVVRDADIGTDQECFSCGGSGVDEDIPASPKPVAKVLEEIQELQAEIMRVTAANAILIQRIVNGCTAIEVGAMADNDKSPSDYKQGISKGASDCLKFIQEQRKRAASTPATLTEKKE